MADVVRNTIEIDEDTLKDRFLTFSLGEENYGIDIKYVIEIVGIQAITEMPDFPEYVKGVINLRGKIILVLDLRLRLKKELKEYNDRTCVIVVDINEMAIGFIVDNVAEVITISEENMVDPPQMNKGLNNSYIKKIGKIENDIKLILDCEKLITENELKNINEIL